MTTQQTWQRTIVILIILAVASQALFVLGCGNSGGREPADAGAAEPASVALSTATPFPSPTLVPTPTFAPTSTPAPARTTPTPKKDEAPDISAAALTVQDFPAGFKALTEAELKQLNFPVSQLEDSLGSFSEAKVRNFTGFMHPTNFVIVFAFTVYPLSALEKGMLELSLASSPDTFIQGFVAGVATSASGAQGAALPGADAVGERSAGATVLIPGQVPMRVDMLFWTRASAMPMLMLLYPDGTQPGVGAVSLAKVLDSRITKAVSQ